jgi:hypothetical protein
VQPQDDPADGVPSRARYWRTAPEKLTTGLLALSVVAMGVVAALGMI